MEKVVIPKEAQIMSESGFFCSLCGSQYEVEYCQLPTKNDKKIEIRCPCCDNFYRFEVSITEPKYTVINKSESADRHRVLVKAAKELPEFTHYTFCDYFEHD